MLDPFYTKSDRIVAGKFDQVEYNGAGRVGTGWFVGWDIPAPKVAAESGEHYYYR